MGYYTYFTLNVYGPEDDIKKMEEEAEKIVDDDDSSRFMGGIKMLVRGESIDAKWYDYADDFEEWARRFPTLLFVLDGDGEDSDDIWQHRFKGELSERVDMVMPPFSNKELYTADELN